LQITSLCILLNLLLLLYVELELRAGDYTAQELVLLGHQEQWGRQKQRLGTGKEETVDEVERARW
jgi:hypothetical protein